MELSDLLISYLELFEVEYVFGFPVELLPLSMML